jgi:hypothetical protein
MRQTAPCAAWGEDRRAVEPGRRAGRVMSSNAPEPCRRRMHDRCRRRVGAIRAGRCRTSDLVRGYTDPTATRQIRCGYRRRVNAGCAVACSSRRRRRPPTLRRRPLASPHGERSRAAVRRVGCVPRRTHRAGCASEQSERAEVARVKLARGDADSIAPINGQVASESTTATQQSDTPPAPPHGDAARAAACWADKGAASRTKPVLFRGGMSQG